MATKREDSGLQLSTSSRFAQLKGQLFEGILLLSTLFGIVSLLVLFGYTALDAFQPLTASALWYLLYFGTLVAPTAAFTLYAIRNPAVRKTNAKTFAVVFGSLAVSLVTYIVAQAVSPYDILIYLVFVTVPPVAVCAYTQRGDDDTYVGPAITVSILIGVCLAAATYGIIRPYVGILAAWIAYFGFVSVPVATIFGGIALRRWSRKRSVLVASTILVANLAVAVVALGTGLDPSVWLVLLSGFVVPVAFVMGDTLLNESDGRIGLIGPFVLIGGMLLGAFLERQIGINGLESYLTPTLVLESWNNLDAAETGVYPQIVGSIMIVGVMAVMAFPVGIGAAIFLEEYAPESGWLGRFATVLEVNISNLAGVPSVVYGILGLTLFRSVLDIGSALVISAAGTLGLLILPIVVVSTQEALRSVPDSLRDASYGMGASRWQTLRNVVFPEAVPGILTGTILALARAIGETAPLVIIGVATTTYTAPEGLFSGATALPLQIFAARANVDEAFRHGIVPATAIVLLVLMLAMNTTAIVIRNRYNKEN